MALAVLDKMDKKHQSGQHCFHKGIPNAAQYLQPPAEEVSDQDFTITLRELMQYSISQSDNNACDILIEYAGGIKHINDYIHRLSIDSFNLSKQKTACTSLRLYTATEYSFRYGPTTENG